MALRRLRRELSAINKEDSDEDIHLQPNEDNIRQWEAVIRGPPDTPFSGRYFQMRIQVNDDYPIAPPSIVFTTKVFHPNVNFKTGEICLDILKKEWSPAWGLQAACRAIIALLSDPDVDSPWNCDAGNMIRAGDKLAFESTARLYAVEYGLEQSSVDK